MAAKRHRLAQRRKTVGFTQEGLAEQLGIDPKTVRRWESGETEDGPQPWLRPNLAHCLQISTDQLEELLNEPGTTDLSGDSPRVGSTTTSAQAQSREAAPATAYAEVQARVQELRADTGTSPSPDGNGHVLPTGQEVLGSLVSAVGAELAGSLAGPLLYLAFLSTPATPAQAVPIEHRAQLREQLQTFLREWANTMERREHLRLLGWMAAAVAASPILNLDSDEQERLSKVIAVPSRVDEQAIDHIETILQDCKRQEDTFGPHAVLHTVIAQRELVDSLLDECPEELRPRLLSVYSSMSSSIGFYQFDLDDAASGMEYCDQARAAAQEARNTELAVYALCDMSYIASWEGKAHSGLDFAAAAQSLVGKTGDVLLQVFAAVQTGFAYAIDGQYKECMTAFDRALAGLESSVGQISPESPAYWYHEGLVYSEQSYCLLRLGRPVEAAASASRGLRLFDNSFVGSLAFCMLRLGTARLLSGEVEEAARVIGEGALLATKNRSARLTSEVSAARRRLQPWHNTAAVRELDERLRGYGMGGM
ncbi:MAG: helix-turn-helix domain-containing protein [Pseudonocardiaceae bacterium]